MKNSSLKTTSICIAVLIILPVYIQAEPIIEKAIANSPTDGFVALRSEPSVKEGERLVKIPHGAELTLIGCQRQTETIGKVKGRWCKTEYDSQEGWVFDAFLKTANKKQLSLAPTNEYEPDDIHPNASNIDNNSWLVSLTVEKNKEVFLLLNNNKCYHKYSGKYASENLKNLREAVVLSNDGGMPDKTIGKGCWKSNFEKK